MYLNYIDTKKEPRHRGGMRSDGKKKQQKKKTMRQSYEDTTVGQKRNYSLKGYAHPK